MVMTTTEAYIAYLSRRVEMLEKENVMLEKQVVKLRGVAKKLVKELKEKK